MGHKIVLFHNFVEHFTPMKLFPLLILSFLLSSCYEKNRNCSDFKTGTFSFKYTIDGVEKTGKFVRTSDLNIDYFENTTDTANVRWINDCEFILTKVNPKSKSEERAIHMKILSTTSDSYTFEYSLALPPANQKKRIEKGTAHKID